MRHRQRVHQTGLSTTVGRSYHGFRVGAMKAVRHVFGSQVQTRGCFFHLWQSSFRKVQELGLVKLYKSDDSFRQLCGMIDGLAFLPICKINDGVKFLQSIMPNVAKDLFNYFVSTYTNSEYTTIGGVVRMHEPTFKPETWNVYDVTKVGGDRTNNYSEGWNNGFRHLVGHNHPSIWRLIDALQADQAQSSAKLLQFSAGNLPSKKQFKASKKLQTLLQKLISECDQGQRSVEQFLRAVSHTIRFVK